MVNTNGLNVVAYAVGTRSNLLVTLINKEYGQDAPAAAVTIRADGFQAAGADALYLTAPRGDVSATNGVTLGGAGITNDAPWNGKWEPASRHRDGQFGVTLAPASAAVVRISGM